MLLSQSAVCLAALLLLNGLCSVASANESLKQQPPLELPKTLNDLELPGQIDSAKSDPVKKAPKNEASKKEATQKEATVKSEATTKSEVKGVDLPPAKALPSKDLSGLPEFGNYKTKAGDTVDKVLQKFYANTPLRNDVLRDALVHNNPKAFVKGNAKNLIPGSTLSLPDPLALARKIMVPGDNAPADEPVKVIPLANPVHSAMAPVLPTPAVPGGGGAVAHSSGHNLPVQDVKRSWVRYP